MLDILANASAVAGNPGIAIVPDPDIDNEVARARRMLLDSVQETAAYYRAKKIAAFLDSRAD